MHRERIVMWIIFRGKEYAIKTWDNRWGGRNFLITESRRLIPKQISTDYSVHPLYFISLHDKIKYYIMIFIDQQRLLN